MEHFNLYRPTLFIIGAGASTSYGFPCGRDLVEQICHDIKHETEIQTYLTETIEIDQCLLNYFSDTFYDARNYSIDEFLESRKDLKGLARKVVAAKIMQCENPHKMKGSISDWLSIYLRALFEGANSICDARLASSKVTFVTLNYDRSIEHVLFSMLKARFDCMEQSNRIPDTEFLEVATSRVRHLHGSVGKYQQEESATGKPYNMDFPSKDIFESIAQKLMFWDDRSNEAESHSLLNAQVRTADQIFLLGFGFHKGILNRFQPNAFAGKNIYCTAKGLGENSWADVVRFLCPGYSVHKIPPYKAQTIQSVRFGNKDQSCDSFMSELLDR